jgi:hypothetical protein
VAWDVVFCKDVSREDKRDVQVADARRHRVPGKSVEQLHEAGPFRSEAQITPRNLYSSEAVRDVAAKQKNRMGIDDLSFIGQELVDVLLD